MPLFVKYLKRLGSSIFLFTKIGFRAAVSTEHVRVRTEFVSMVAFRSTHKGAFGKYAFHEFFFFFFFFFFFLVLRSFDCLLTFPPQFGLVFCLPVETYH